MGEKWGAIGNSWGTCQELGNSSFWQSRPPPTHKRERGALSLHDTTSHWLHGNSIHKIGCHYFWPGLIALPKNTPPIQSFWKMVESPSTSKFKEKLMVSSVFIPFTLVWLILNTNIYAPSNITNVQTHVPNMGLNFEPIPVQLCTN